MSEIPEKNDTINFVGSNLPGGGFSQWDDYWFNNGINLTANSSPDTISINSNLYSYDNGMVTPNSKVTELNENENNFWKFEENKTLKVIKDYIVGTYNAHYASEKSKVQVLDIIDAIGDGIPFCRTNLIKYSARFGKKNGFSKLDALKIIHYGILMYHFAGFHNETKNNNETF